MSKKFKINDRVKVIGTGHIYMMDSYMFEQMGFVNKKFNNTPALYDNDFIIFSIKKHHEETHSVYGIRNKEGVELLIRAKGLKLIKQKTIDRVTIERLDAVMKLCNIDFHKELIDKIIDMVELIEDKGGDVTLTDISNMKKEWSK